MYDSSTIATSFGKKQNKTMFKTTLNCIREKLK